jgi:hypothetical protein
MGSGIMANLICQIESITCRARSLVEIGMRIRPHDDRRRASRPYADLMPASKPSPFRVSYSFSDPQYRARLLSAEFRTDAMLHIWCQ